MKKFYAQLGLELTSLQNSRIKSVLKLRERRHRDKERLFLIEGYRELLRAVDSGVQLHSLFYCPEFFLGENNELLLQKILASKFVCDKKVFKKLSYRDRPDGFLAVAYQMGKTILDLKPSKKPLYVIAEGIEKPGNLGTILRSSDAVGADGVIVVDRCTDIYNPNVVRASVGALFTQPVVEGGSEEFFLWLKTHGIKILASTPHADLEFTKADLTCGMAIAVGTEQYGLTEQWLKQSDIQVKIPMHGIADSLNVATATTLLLYEVLRQRGCR